MFNDLRRLVLRKRDGANTPSLFNLKVSVVKFFVYMSCVILCTGCARTQLQPTISIDDFQQESALENSVTDQKEILSQDAVASPPTVEDNIDLTDYVLGSGDLLTLTVYESDELNTETRVNSRGDITMPLVGRINLEGLTTSEAEKKIEQALLKDYMHVAHVSLFVKERMNQHITLVGAVKQPGTFETQTRKRLLEVLAYAGGLTSTSGDTAYVTRKTGKGDQNKVFIIDLDALLTQGRMDMNMIIQGSDVIFVPESDMVQVDGAVRRPGSIKIDGKLTIDEAIASAGGLAVYADDDDIKLIRKNKIGKREIVQLSMKDIVAMKEKEIQAGPLQELLLQNGDIIFIEADGIRSFYSGVGFSIGFLGTGINFSNPTK